MVSCEGEKRGSRRTTVFRNSTRGGPTKSMDRNSWWFAEIGKPVVLSLGIVKVAQETPILKITIKTWYRYYQSNVDLVSLLVNEALLIVRRHTIASLCYWWHSLKGSWNWTCPVEVTKKIVWTKLVLGLREWWRNGPHIGTHKAKLLWDLCIMRYTSSEGSVRMILEAELHGSIFRQA